MHLDFIHTDIMFNSPAIQYMGRCLLIFFPNVNKYRITDKLVEKKKTFSTKSSRCDNNNPNKNRSCIKQCDSNNKKNLARLNPTYVVKS